MAMKLNGIARKKLVSLVDALNGGDPQLVLVRARGLSSMVGEAGMFGNLSRDHATLLRQILSERPGTARAKAAAETQAATDNP